MIGFHPCYCAVIKLNIVIATLFLGLFSVSAEGNNALRALAQNAYYVNRFHSFDRRVVDSASALILHHVTVSEVMLGRIDVIIIQVGRVTPALIATVVGLGVVAGGLAPLRKHLALVLDQIALHVLQRRGFRQSVRFRRYRLFVV